MRLVVLGPNGRVGWELVRSLAPLGEVRALGRQGPGGLCGDLEKPEELERTLEQLRPHVIANAAAYTDVDGAEEAPALARRVNAEGPAALAAAAGALDALLVHFSTDYVFDGSGAMPWREHDPTGPLNVYGRTKRDGERAVADAGCRHLIFRTQWLYGPRGDDFVHAMLRAALEQDALEVVDDQVGAPTGAALVADVTAHAVRTAIARRGVSGT